VGSYLLAKKPRSRPPGLTRDTPNALTGCPGFGRHRT
jgi:hypothetical protein